MTVGADGSAFLTVGVREDIICDSWTLRGLLLTVGSGGSVRASFFTFGSSGFSFLKIGMIGESIRNDWGIIFENLRGEERGKQGKRQRGREREREEKGAAGIHKESIGNPPSGIRMEFEGINPWGIRRESERDPQGIHGE